MIALFVSNQYERYGFMEGGLASFFSSHKFLIFQKTKRKGRSRRRRLPAVSRFYRAHRMSPSLGAWVSDKRESRGLSEEEESASPPPSIPLLPAFVVFEGTSSRVASLIRTRETRKNDFVRRGTMREGEENLCILPKSRERRKSRSSRRYIIVGCLLFSRVFLLGSRKNACRESGVEK